MQASPTILELLASSAVLAILTVVFALRPRRFTAGMALRVAAGASLYAVLDAFLHVLNPMPCIQLNRQWPLEGVWLCFWPSAAIAMLSGYAWGARVGFLTGLLGSAISDALLSRGLWLNWEIGVGLLGLVPGIFKARTGEKRGKSSVVLYVAIVVASAAGMSFATYVGCIFRYSGLRLGEAANAFFISTFFNAVVNGVTLASPMLLVRYYIEAHARARAERLTRDLFAAVKSGNVAEVEKLLKHGAGANAKDNDGATPLHLAAQEGHVKVAELLIKNGTDINAKANDGWTPTTLCNFP
jgi:energy-coupling factor transport system substrate-specific component